MHYPVLVCYSDNQTKNNQVSNAQYSTAKNYQFAVPDMPGCEVTAKSIELGLQKLQTVIENHLDILVEYGEQIPTASSIEYHLNLQTAQAENFMTWLMIEVDILPYLGKSHKINVTLPERLIQKIDTKVNTSPNYKTRSHFIAQACLQELKPKNDLENY